VLTVVGFFGAYHIAMPYPLGRAVWLCFKVIVEFNPLGWLTGAVIEGAI
jgi:hypothetical protein